MNKTITINRYHEEKDPQHAKSVFDLETSDERLLDALQRIKMTKDPSLTFNSGCRSGVCGSCGVSVNGQPVLSCKHKVQDGDEIAPMKNYAVIKDLVVDHEKGLQTLPASFAWMFEQSDAALDHDSVKRISKQSECILCGLCYSACPVYEVNDAFLGPFALTRVWRYNGDLKEHNIKDKIDTIQNSGVWDCTLCDACTFACPQGISSKRDIEMLRMQSTQQGYMDPNFGNFGGLDFGAPQF
jgi:fumarate reductase iron-sulfur subunit